MEIISMSWELEKESPLGYLGCQAFMAYYPSP
jgi:hypothetical protein